jgi:hypothetical protein
MLYPHVPPRLLRGLFRSCFSTKTLYALLISPTRATSIAQIRRRKRSTSSSMIRSYDHQIINPSTKLILGGGGGIMNFR